jgi:hypothetical protein
MEFDIAYFRKIGSCRVQRWRTCVNSVKCFNSWGDEGGPSPATTTKICTFGVSSKFVPRKDAEVVSENLLARFRIKRFFRLVECTPFATEALNGFLINILDGIHRRSPMSNPAASALSGL